MSKKSIFVFAAVVVALFCGLTARAGDLNGRLANVLGSSEFDGASVSILAVTAGGDTLLCRDATRQCVPASNMKLVTTALALHSLGADYRYRTSIGYSGYVSDGILHGDLYVIGGGDPTLGSHNRIAEPFDNVLAQWLELVRGAGIRQIDGYVIGDGRFFPGMREQESWQLNDSGTYYGAGVSGLTFYENELDFRVAPGAAEGEPLDIRPVYPDVPWMSISYACSTGARDSGNSLYFYTTDFSPVGEMRGTFALNRQPKTEGAANKFPEYTVANYFTDCLETNGIACGKGPADLGHVFRPGEDDFTAPNFDEYFKALSAGGKFDSSSADDGSSYNFNLSTGDATSCYFNSSDGSFTILGSTESPSLKTIVEATNRESNNMYAETLMKTLGRELAGDGTYLGACKAEAQLLSKLAVATGPGDGTLKGQGGSATIRDGSGLSREDHVSAAFLCSLLKAMMQTPVYATFVSSLPYPGSAGTLAAVLKSVPESDRPRIRMKSGSMGGVRCFSGYILPVGTSASQAAASQTDTVIFSILVNNFGVPTYRIQRKIEEIIMLLTE
ncbi:MAG: D-alanyl-D-alanine carboxypeptidase [Bacteroidales bacterium]|nr:D-alanyl-D-alanine carboxypeptidase [Bacteroidales bacterium]